MSALDQQGDKSADMLDPSKMDARDEESRRDALNALANEDGVTEVAAPENASTDSAGSGIGASSALGTGAVGTGTGTGAGAGADLGASTDLRANPGGVEGSALGGSPSVQIPELSQNQGIPDETLMLQPVPTAKHAQEPAPAPRHAQEPAQPAPEANATPAPAAQEPQEIQNGSPSETLPFTPVKLPTRTSVSASGHTSGSGRATGALVWSAATNVGHVREHNEDSYLINFPLFAVADGMGGHAAGEVASTITVSSLAESGITKADPYALGSAIEQANQEVIAGAASGVGRQGMGTTCTSVVIDGNRMAVGHVGDSRAYLLHNGKLRRVTRDHSLVEELVEAGKITPEEARVHPNRSVITRALGSDPNMRADAFTVDVTLGDRVLLCSDGLSSMVDDDVIEDVMVSSPSASVCTDHLIDLALAAGGLDNVTVIVIDVVDDGIERHALRNRIRNIALWVLAVLLVLALIIGGLLVFAHSRWYLTDTDGYVSLNRGIPGNLGPISLSEQVEVTNIEVSKLSQAVESRLASGISFGSEDEARATLEKYRIAIENDEQARAEHEREASDSFASSSDGMSASSPPEGALTVIRSEGASSVYEDSKQQDSAGDSSATDDASTR